MEKWLEALEVAIRDHDWLRVRVAAEGLRAVLVKAVSVVEGSASAKRPGKDGSAPKGGE